MAELGLEKEREKVRKPEDLDKEVDVEELELEKGKEIEKVDVTIEKKQIECTNFKDYRQSRMSSVTKEEILKVRKAE